MNVKEYKAAAAVLRSGGRLPLEVFKEYKQNCRTHAKRYHAINRRSALVSGAAFNNVQGGMNTAKK